MKRRPSFLLRGVGVSVAGSSLPGESFVEDTRTDRQRLVSERATLRKIEKMLSRQERRKRRAQRRLLRLGGKVFELQAARLQPIAKPLKINPSVEKLGQSRSLRLTIEATPAEQRVIRYLHELGCEYEFQKVFCFKAYPRIVDFFFKDINVAVEIDGKSHLTKSGKETDRIRAMEFLEYYPHIRFIRFKNREVFTDGFRATLARCISKI